MSSKTARAISKADYQREIGPLHLLPDIDQDVFRQNNNQLSAYERNLKAVQLYLETDATLASIESFTGVGRRQLYRLLIRMITPVSDGVRAGKRGLIPGVHLTEYTRNAVVIESNAWSISNAVGAMGKLFRDYPPIKEWLYKTIIKRLKPLKKGEVRQIRQSVSSIHGEFLEKCLELGVQEHEYPFNQDLRGYRSIQSLVKKVEQLNSVDSRDNENQIEEDFPFKNGLKAALSVSPFSLVQFDGHKIDVRVTISVEDVHGTSTLLEIKRIWLLCFTSVLSKACLGYSLCIRSEYSSNDVALALYNALGIQPRIDLTIPKLSIKEGGGFPNQMFSSAAYQKWGWLQFDEAKAHLSRETLDRFVSRLGIWTISGRRGVPNDRNFQERFFGLLEECGLHNIPGTLGSRPDDKARKLADVGQDLTRIITYSELQQLVYVFLSNLNATPLASLASRTPNSSLRYFISKDGFIDERIPEFKRAIYYLLQKSKICVVRGGQDGVPVHVNFGYLRYTSSVLRRQKELVGQKLTLHYVDNDIRTVAAYLSDGSELGTLTAPRPWDLSPHSLETRTEIMREVKQGKLKLRLSDDPIRIYSNYKRELAKNNKREATIFHRVSKEIESGNAFGPLQGSDTAGNPDVPLEQKEGSDQLNEDKSVNKPAKREIIPTEVNLGGGIIF